MWPIRSSVESTQMIVRAAIILHNFLHQTNNAGYCLGRFVDSYDSNGKLKEGNGDRLSLMGENLVFLMIFQLLEDSSTQLN